MVVFAPGQLGDMGYADNVMSGVNLLSMEIDEESIESNTLDVNFISPENFASLQQSIANWVSNAENPFVEGAYERRLLVLTESYMIPMLSHLYDKLRPTDEVLVFKVNDDDVREAAEKYGLGNRLHGLNISAAASIRRYYRFMRQYINLLNYAGINDVNPNRLRLIRLYDDQEVAYRDSVYETLAEEMGDSAEIAVTSMSDLQHEGLYYVGSEMPIIEVAYFYASVAQLALEMSGTVFNIINLGSGNIGWNYSLMGQLSGDRSFQTLVIDSDDMPLAYHCYVKRFFGLALVNWCLAWTEDRVGAMPRMAAYSNDEYCADNIPDIEDLLNTLD